jgi:hypothetical protein
MKSSMFKLLKSSLAEKRGIFKLMKSSMFKLLKSS